ncbi:MAG: hypothetical protein U0791_26225 [Gemmataceae bacterium]
MSYETDLMQDHPIHAVTEWIGNTPRVALRHYLQVLESDFAKAVNGGAETGAVSNGQQQSGGDRIAANAGKQAVWSQPARSCLFPSRLQNGR